MGTGCSILTNIGSKYQIKDKYITTLSFVFNGKPFYSYECLINFAGATISWLKNNLKIINSEKETNKICKSTKESRISIDDRKSMFTWNGGLCPSEHQKSINRDLEVYFRSWANEL